MPKTNLASMSVDALLKLRDDIGATLGRKAKELEGQLSRLGHGIRRTSRGSTLKGRKVAVKYRDRSGNTWAGRGAQPVWLREELKAGAKLEDFAVQRRCILLDDKDEHEIPHGQGNLVRRIECQTWRG